MSGTLRPPGDKSISHRALMFGALTVGETRISGLLAGDDVMRTAAALRALGAEITRESESGDWIVHGRGVGGLSEPDDVLDMGNSGTGARLLLGILAGHPITAFLTGDGSLRGRPMERVMAPLRDMGAQFESRQGGRLPLMVRGTAMPMAMEYRLPVSSAQVKSAVLLAGLHAPGQTTVIEPQPSRDHTEHLLRAFGASVEMSPLGPGPRTITLTGQPELHPVPVIVPADPSSAAFPLVAALITPGSEVVLDQVGTNPLRAGLFTCLQEMGADLSLDALESPGEPLARITARSSALTAITVPAERAPSMIDEYPILAVAAAHARGTTRMEGIGELRVKESDRLAAMAEGLAACGVTVRAGDDWMEVDGTGRPPAGGARIDADLDHRIAMAFLVLGMAAARPVTVDGVDTVATSFPGFADLMNGLGARITMLGAEEAHP